MTPAQLKDAIMPDPDNGYGPPGTPAYLRVLIAVLRTSGPTVVIALVLLWFVMTNVSSGLNVLQTKMTTASVEMGAFAAEQRAFNARRESQLDVQLRIMRTICSNGAKSEAALKACME
jgi:hypothetical protein